MASQTTELYLVTCTTCCIKQSAAGFRLALLQWQADIAKLERGHRTLRHVAASFACGAQFDYVSTEREPFIKDQGTSKVRQSCFEYMHMYMPKMLI